MTLKRTHLEAVGESGEKVGPIKYARGMTGQHYTYYSGLLPLCSWC